jgi:hypothetical protein
LFGLVNFLLLLVLLAGKILDEVWWYWVHAASPDKKKKERSRLCHHLLVLPSLTVRIAILFVVLTQGIAISLVNQHLGGF